MFGSRSRGRSAPYVSPIVTLPLAPSYSTPADAPALQAGMHTYNPAFSGITPGGSAPQIAVMDDEAIPGSVVSVAGDAFTSNTTIRFYSQTSSANATALADATQIWTDSANGRVVTVPATLPNGLIIAYPYDTVNGYGTPYVLNRAVALRVQTASTGNVSGYVGAKAYIFGKYLRSGSNVWAYMDGYGYLTLTYSDDECLEFTIPSIATGTYNIWLHNGKGGAYGWSESPISLTITTAAALSRDYTATSVALVCPNDSAVDSKTAIDAAIATINSAGTVGEIVLGAGHWYISAPSTYSGSFGKAIRIRGAGPASTILHRKSGFSNDLFMNMNSKGSVEGLKIDLNDGVGTSTTGRDSCCILGALEVRNVTIDSRGIYKWAFAGSSDQTLGTVVDGCTFTGWPIFSNKMQNVLVTNNNFVLAGRPDTAAFFSAGKNLSMISNDISHVDYTDVTGYSRGFRAVVFDATAGRHREAYFGRNTTHKMWALSGYGDAENVLCDGGGGTFFAQATGATGTTVNVATAAYTAISANTRYAVIVKGKGLGQWAEITGIATSGSDKVLTVDRTWKVTPDTTSWIHVTRQMENLVVAGNTFQGNNDYTANTCAVHLFNGGLRCLIKGNTISDMKQPWTQWANDLTTTGSVANQPSFFNAYITNTSTNSQYGGRYENSGKQTNQTYNQFGDKFRGNSITTVTTRGLYVRTSNTGGMWILDANTISTPTKGVYEDTSVNGGQLILINNTITGDGTGSSKSIDTTTAPAAVAMTITQSPASGQFTGFVA